MILLKVLGVITLAALIALLLWRLFVAFMKWMWTLLDTTPTPKELEKAAKKEEKRKEKEEKRFNEHLELLSMKATPEIIEKARENLKNKENIYIDNAIVINTAENVASGWHWRMEQELKYLMDHPQTQTGGYKESVYISSNGVVGGSIDYLNLWSQNLEEIKNLEDFSDAMKNLIEQLFMTGFRINQGAWIEYSDLKIVESYDENSRHKIIIELLHNIQNPYYVKPKEWV